MRIITYDGKSRGSESAGASDGCWTRRWGVLAGELSAKDASITKEIEVAICGFLTHEKRCAFWSLHTESSPCHYSSLWRAIRSIWISLTNRRPCCRWCCWEKKKVSWWCIRHRLICCCSIIHIDIFHVGWRKIKGWWRRHLVRRDVLVRPTTDATRSSIGF